MINKEYVVYFYYTKEKELIYVGLTTNCYQRVLQHRSSDDWFNEVFYIGIKRYPNRVIMEICEKYYILFNKPKYNKKDNVEFEDNFTICLKDEEIEDVHSIEEYITTNKSTSCYIGEFAKTNTFILEMANIPDKEWTTIQNYSKERGVSAQSVYSKLKRYKDDLLFHIKKIKGTTVIDDYAITYIDKHSINNNDSQTEALLITVSKLKQTNKELLEKLKYSEDLLTKYVKYATDYVM